MGLWHWRVASAWRFDFSETLVHENRNRRFSSCFELVYQRCMTFEFESTSLAETDQLAAAFAKAVPAGTVVSLIGELGAGKTRFVQGFCEALGIEPDDVSSPTFVLCQHYAGEKMVHHFDAYRLHDEDEFIALGPEEYFDSAGVTFVEWANRVSAAMPEEAITITIEPTGDASRLFQFQAATEASQHVIEQLRLLVDSR